MQEQLYVNREYKDSVFRMLYREKKNLLQLYNALNGTSHTDPEELIVTTLENAIYLGMKNDVSFLLDDRMTLYEHQSTWNPNLPLRDLLYISRLLEKHVNAGNRSIYSSSLIRIPAPRFVVFYNGQRRVEDHTVLKLSDAFEKPEKDPALELRVRLVNINPGASPELMERCRTLREYSEFVARIRKHIDEEASIQEAVEQAVSECIREGILAEFLRSQRSEVVAMSIFEYDHEVEMKKLTDELRETIRAEEHERALAEARAEVEEATKKLYEEAKEKNRTEGRAEGQTHFLLLVLDLRGAVPDWLKERIRCEKDPRLLEDWMKAAADAVSVEDFLSRTGLKESV
ncbi:MAG TPA: Rpn family recombination-promoting nuclease/putative transposase [Candidatus Eisenbergiella stercorigallinarum]|uniref:Rpn family recombination-promoting nuclease/putative transposase n=1 Tax=Candidatus Eisenbergiella stercorigallinarum TaxID=2838557 RepID=A0A9D2TYS3_9FIRM|nr:Rpn family recombination-promoting nuclease/putative transposase [Candidatus Eisenbergiella stercorigallinarum]